MNKDKPEIYRNCDSPNDVDRVQRVINLKYEVLNTDTTRFVRVNTII